MSDRNKKSKVEKLIEKFLAKRNILEKINIKKFIKSDFLDFKNPFDFENMKEIVDRIIEIRDKGEKIFVYGDYDVDGISGTAFLVRVFQDLGIDVDYYIPNRSEIDYGVSEKNIDYFHKRNGKLIITVDTGYNSIEAVRYAKSLGIDIIVTDHHKTIKETFDDEILYLNPKLSENYSFKYLSGAGVAFKLAQGLYETLNLNMDNVYKYLDIVMIGTIADVVPMINENRIIIKNGLKILKKTKIKGLSYLLNYLRLSRKDITTTDISYYVSPLINSLGRVGISRLGADFFIKDDDFEIYNIIEEMKFQNRERRNLEKLIYDDAMKMIKKLDMEKEKYLMLSSSRWNTGVIGVVSSKLSIKYHLPVILIAFEGNYGKASCRSVEDISIFNILMKAKNLLVRFGGHDLAAGFTVHKDKLKDLRKVFDENIPKISKEKRESSEEKSKKFDFKIPLNRIEDEKIFEFMKEMSPFGLENPHPLFFDEGINFKEIKKFGINDRHFSGILVKNNLVYYTVGFDLADKIKDEKKEYNIIYYPEKIFQKDKEIIQIVLKDIN